MASDRTLSAAERRARPSILLFGAKPRSLQPLLAMRHSLLAMWRTAW
jgi:hypothetical protein